MPSNDISGTSCSIYPINHPTLPAGLPAQEYKHHSFKSTATGAIQEIVTIESNEGTAFEIKLEINPTAYSLLHQTSDQSNSRPAPDDYLIYVQLDGIVIQRSKRHRSQLGPTIISGVYSTDLKTSRLFQFGKLHLVDPDDNNAICQDEKIIQALGTIQVNIVRCLLGQPAPVPNGNRSRPPPHHKPRGPAHHSRARGDPDTIQTTNQMIFSERSKKACQLNTVGLGKPVPARSGRSSFAGKKTARPVQREDPNPFLQFIFKYKPRSILEAERIIAPPPPPPPSPPRGVTGSRANRSRQPSVKTKIPNNHDYYSNSELHQGSRAADEKQILPKEDPDDEKKPAKEPSYIVINSDGETDDSEAGTKRKAPKATANGRPRGSNVNDHNTDNIREIHNRTGGGIGTSKSRALRSDHAGRDENRPELVDQSISSNRSTSDSKKRIRSSTTTNGQPSKRRCSLIGNSNDHANGGTLGRRTRELNSQSEAHALYRESKKNDAYLDDSSDDDDEFKDRITGKAPKTGYVRAGCSKDDPRLSKGLHHSQNKKTDAGEKQTSQKRFITTDQTSARTSTSRTASGDRSGYVGQNGSENEVIDLTELCSE